MPTVSAFLRARYLMPSPLVAPTRMRCITPSGMIASGSPLSTENSSTSPTQRLPGAAGTFSRTTVLPRFGKGHDVGVDADRADAELGAHAVHRFEAVDRVGRFASA